MEYSLSKSYFWDLGEKNEEERLYIKEEGKGTHLWEYIFRPTSSFNCSCSFFSLKETMGIIYDSCGKEERVVHSQSFMGTSVNSPIAERKLKRRGRLLSGVQVVSRKRNNVSSPRRDIN